MTLAELVLVALVVVVVLLLLLLLVLVLLLLLQMVLPTLAATLSNALGHTGSIEIYRDVGLLAFPLQPRLQPGVR